MRYIPPISKGEFLQYLQPCIPHKGWPGKIAVANSGGPDSVCLLFLLASLLKNEQQLRGGSVTPTPGLPSEIVSLHCDHNLQSASASMATQAAQTASHLGIPHFNLPIPWSTCPYPPHPDIGSRRAATAGQTDGDASPSPTHYFEQTCRDARRRRLFDAAMSDSVGASVLAFAHHADDQVETSVMRLASGSGYRGASGMRYVRRWGMGEREDRPLTWFGAQGMKTHIIRPLLGVSKDRILATCEAHGLEYVIDPTNSQPAITLRNYVRDVLKRDGGQLNATENRTTSSSLFAGKAAKVNDAVHSLRALSPNLIGSNQLRDAVRLIGGHVERVDSQVTEFLLRNLLPSPPTTLLLPFASLQAIRDKGKDVRTALIRRILRYVSPYPWGSMAAEAYGSREALDAFDNLLWPLTFRSSTSEMITPPSFTHGANVWWRPVHLRENKVGFGKSTSTGNGEEDIAHPTKAPQRAWLIQRAKPWSAARLQQLGQPDMLTKNITSELRDALLNKDDKAHFSVLYDCRVLVRFDMRFCPPAVAEAIKGGGASVHLTPDTPFMLPQVVLKRDHGRLDNQVADTVLASFPWPTTQMRKLWVPKQPLCVVADERWIQMEFVRSLDPW